MRNWKPTVARFKRLRQKAYAGDPAAQLTLGRCYEESWHVRKSPRRAFNWYLKAAQGGEVEAAHFVAFAYSLGEGVPRNLKKAFDWFKIGAERGDIDAVYELGQCYLFGYGVRKSGPRGMELLRRAARKGKTLAFYMLGWAYEHGDAPDGKNLALARRWYRRAADRGDADSANILSTWSDRHPAKGVRSKKTSAPHSGTGM
jgi:TPR repeat protein